MEFLLAIDIGNTNITAGIFAAGGQNPIKKIKIPTANFTSYESSFARLLGSWARSGDIDVIISSVVPQALLRLTKILNKIAECRKLILGENIDVPIKNLYKRKSEVGQDRLVNAYAAGAIYGTPAIVVDFGTAVTFDVISKKGAYLGGLILPGIEMGLISLYEKTAALPKVNLAPAGHIIGKTTVESIRGGMLYGYAAMVDGLVSKYKNILGSRLKTIATGGNAGLMKRYSKSILMIDSDLTLKGLNLIFKKN